MITSEEVKKLFELAKVDATESEMAKFPKELDSILEYVKKLQSADLSGVPPVVSISRNINSLREDESFDAGNNARQAFPESTDGYLKTKKVFDNS